MLDELKRRQQHSALSLDAPLTHTSRFCLADTIAAPSSTHASDATSTRTDAVHTALSRLSPREREVILHRYGFDGSCGILKCIDYEIGQALGMTRSSAGSIATVAHRKLQKDAELCKAIGVEPPPEEAITDEVRAERKVTYARELAAWKAGSQTSKSLAKALGVSRSTAYKHMKKLQEAGLIVIGQPVCPPKGMPA
jgi:DNA-binding CsgD family transcriptional regulator